MDGSTIPEQSGGILDLSISIGLANQSAVFSVFYFLTPLNEDQE
jgi:hypothetical protein